MARSPLVDAPGNGGSDAMRPTQLSNAATPGGFVPDNTLRAEVRTDPAHPFDGTLLHDLLKGYGFIALSDGQHEGHWLPTTLGTQAIRRPVLFESTSVGLVAHIMPRLLKPDTAGLRAALVRLILPAIALHAQPVIAQTAQEYIIGAWTLRV